MRPDDVLQWIHAAPFQPFRIVLNSGRSYEVRHPEMVRVGRTTMHIFNFISEENDVYERVEMVGLLLIERIEPLSSETAA